jgi:hypothetical protein
MFSAFKKKVTKGFSTFVVVYIGWFSKKAQFQTAISMEREVVK